MINQYGAANAPVQSRAAEFQTDATAAQTAGRAHSVTIYVAQHCFICAYAYEVAEQIRQAFPQIAVRLVDLANPQECVPESVFATPTYVLDGKLWSLGNPSPQQVIDALSKLE